MINGIACLKKPNLEMDLYKLIGITEDFSLMSHTSVINNFVFIANIKYFMYVYVTGTENNVKYILRKIRKLIFNHILALY